MTLAKRAGINLQFEEDSAQGPRFDRNRLLGINREAGRWFHKCLYSSDPEAVAALRYFREKRRLSDATIKHFGLGFAPNNFDGLKIHLQKLGYRDDEMIAAGVCSRSERNGMAFSFFRNRVMFPVIDVSGNIIAFGGRVMDDSVPKYKNTTDTPVFKKSRNLFALNFAHKHCQERLILCEGYMDVIALHAAGFPNAVAALGTAITAEQARLIRRYTQNVIVCTDSDSAGQKAADRAIKLFEEAGLNVKVLKLEGAKDPDEFVQKYGAEKFRSFLDGSRTKFDFTFDKVLMRYDIKDPQQKIEAAMAIADEISKFYSSAERDIYIREAAKRFEIKAESLAHDVDRRIRKRNSDASRQQTEKIRLDLSGLSDKINRDAAKLPAAAKAEEAVLGMLQIYPEHRALLLGENPVLREADFFTELGKRCFSFILEAEQNGGFDPVLLDSEFTADEVGRFTKMRVTRMSLGDNGKEVFLDCASNLRELTRRGTGLGEDMTVNDLESLIESLRKNQDS